MRKENIQGSVESRVCFEQLEDWVREKIQVWVQELLEEEVTELLGRCKSVRHALRHRPDHIVVGEVRGGEAADLLQALNTGHGGSLTTVHANNAESALSRLASCAMQGGGELPWEVTCRGVVDGIAMVIHMTRREGRRFVEEALRVQGYDAPRNRWLIEPIGRQHNDG